MKKYVFTLFLLDDSGYDGGISTTTICSSFDNNKLVILRDNIIKELNINKTKEVEANLHTIINEENSSMTEHGMRLSKLGRILLDKYRLDCFNSYIILKEYLTQEEIEIINILEKHRTTFSIKRTLMIY